ncbi:uncharacterized protein LOC108666379 [Hyalella azteca]|uniref:Uncharacterized protein LOC108666379 n=1 Tax=Hyalella azteca TaxID=294128 RepID=A0A8B7N546_HYAAZ|nr:uncharacterized protein LOC108666379 [Hyalella azteca]XP_018008731.1 uncharacterized protein LOC108666379 [Hyalella azteca]XP_018008732.1 uncharacterized protein LOC108666379 [Hyalella azteca]
MSLAVAAAALDRALKNSPSSIHPPQLPAYPPYRNSFSVKCRPITYVRSRNHRSVSPTISYRKYAEDARFFSSKYGPSRGHHLHEWNKNSDGRTVRRTAEQNASSQRMVSQVDSLKDQIFFTRGLTKNWPRSSCRGRRGEFHGSISGSEIFHSIPRFPFHGMIGTRFHGGRAGFTGARTSCEPRFAQRNSLGSRGLNPCRPLTTYQNSGSYGKFEHPIITSRTNGRFANDTEKVRTTESSYKKSHNGDIRDAPNELSCTSDLNFEPTLMKGPDSSLSGSTHSSMGSGPTEYARTNSVPECEVISEHAPFLGITDLQPEHSLERTKLCTDHVVTSKVFVNPATQDVPLNKQDEMLNPDKKSCSFRTSLKHSPNITCRFSENYDAEICSNGTGLSSLASNELTMAIPSRSSVAPRPANNITCISHTASNAWPSSSAGSGNSSHSGDSNLAVACNEAGHWLTADSLQIPVDEVNYSGPQFFSKEESVAEILEFRSICEERNGSIVVKPDIASLILQGCLSSEKVQTKCWNANETSSTSGGIEECQRSEHEESGFENDVAVANVDSCPDLLFDFIYHSENASFMSSSPKKDRQFSEESAADIEEESSRMPSSTQAVPGVRRRSTSVISSIKSSKKKLVNSGLAKSLNFSEETEVSEHDKVELQSGLENSENGTIVSGSTASTPNAVSKSTYAPALYGSSVVSESELNVFEHIAWGCNVKPYNEPYGVATPTWNEPESISDRRSKSANSSSEVDRAESELQNLSYLDQKQPQESKYKTELCRAFQIRGNCRYGSRCNYAHGLDQLKVSFHHGKYKTRNCQAYHESGYCRYGARCSFIHDLEEGILKCSIANKEILEALHHWPEENTTDRSATVTWRVFSGCRNADSNDTLLEFTAIPSLRPADVDSIESGSHDNVSRIYTLDAGRYTMQATVRSRDETSRDCSQSITKTKVYGSDETIFSENLQPNYVGFRDQFRHSDRFPSSRRPSMIRSSVNDLITLLRSVETSFSFRRTAPQVNFRVNRSRESGGFAKSTRSCEGYGRNENFGGNCDRRNFNSEAYQNGWEEDEGCRLNEDGRGRIASSYKKKKCYSFHQNGFCLYGPYCHFLHDED